LLNQEIFSKIRYFLLFIFLIFLDQISKVLIQKQYLQNNSTQILDIIPNFLNLSYVENPGIAFGIKLGGTIFNIILAVILLIIFLITFIYKKKSPILNLQLPITNYPLPIIHNPSLITHYPLPITIIISGGIGNLIDRFRLSYVIDFINFSFWPAFNLADIYITIGGGVLIYLLYLENKRSGVK